MLGRRVFALESVAARICREAGGRVTSNVMVRDLDLPVPGHVGQSQVGTLVCAQHCDGTPHRGAVDADGVVASAARRRTERTHPEIVGPRSRARS